MDRILIFILYLLLLLVMYIDINKKYIPNILNFSILIISILLVYKENLENFFIGAGAYVLPILIIYGYLSDILRKEVFGFGDIKLIMALGALLYNKNINLFLQIYIFYILAFSLATLYILSIYTINFFNGKNTNMKGMKIAFAPYLIISFILIFNSKYLLGVVYA